MSPCRGSKRIPYDRLGWLPFSRRMEIRTMGLLQRAKKEMRKTDSLHGVIFRTAEHRNTPWFVAAKETLQKYNVAGERRLQITRSRGEYERLEAEWIRNLKAAVEEATKTATAERLAGMVTAELYISTALGAEKREMAKYLVHNSHRKRAVGLIFQLRTMHSRLGEDRYIRHLKEDSYCYYCGDPREDADHMIVECPAYEDDRRNLRETLDAFGVEGELFDVVLYDEVIWQRDISSYRWRSKG
jgi:hypothetical protein